MSTKITALPAGTPLTTDVVPYVDLTGPTTKKSTWATVRTLFMPVSISSEVSGLGANVAAFLGTPSGANLGTALTSTLALAKITPPTGTGLVKVSGGAWVAAGATLVNADVNAAAAIAVSKLAPSGTNGWVLTTTAGVPVWQAPAGGGAAAGGAGQVQTSDGAGGFTAPTNVLAGANFLSVGATPSSALGLLRFPTTVNMLAARNAANGADLVICSTDASDNLFFGSDASSANGYSQVFIETAPNGFLRSGGAVVLTWGASAIQIAQPIIGDASPYAVHGGVVVTPPLNANYTLSSGEYCYAYIQVDKGAWLAGQSIILPAPTSMAAGYFVTIRNNSTFTLVVTTGAGTTRTLATALTRRFWVDSSGVLFASATTTP